MARTVKQYKGKVRKPKKLTAPWSIRIIELLAEHGELSGPKLIAEVGPLVPPGRARRRRETDRISSAKHTKRLTNERQGPRPVSIDQQVEIGQAAIVRWTLRALEQSTRIRSRVRGGVKYYRLGEVERAYRKAKAGGRAGG